MHKISFGFSEKEIGQAVKQVESYKKELKVKISLLIQKLTDTGVQIAKLEVVRLGAYYTGELESSINGYYSANANVGIVYAGAWFAVYVEFGTGVVGAESPHPQPQNWQYDVNGHGDDGWAYYNSERGTFGRTRGKEARPFMYNTVKSLNQMCESIAKEIFRR